jgi:transcriptional regulator with XRE-family HTH domain
MTSETGREDRTGDTVGQRIREIRLARNITLTALAEASDLSAGLVSQVERGLSNPSLETLRKIARVLQVPIFSLFQDDKAELVSVVRRDRRMRVQSPEHDIIYSRISPGRGKLEVLHGVLQPYSASSDEPWSHPSEECVVVLRGTLVVQVSGDDYELQSGDSCYFHSSHPHRYRNPSDDAAEFIISITPPSY